MTYINIQEAKTHLSRYARQVKAGETIILCERNKPFAEIRPLPESPEQKKVVLGAFAGKFEVDGQRIGSRAQEVDRDFSFVEPISTSRVEHRLVDAGLRQNPVAPVGQLRHDFIAVILQPLSFSAGPVLRCL